MTVVSAKPILTATQRNVIWGFIALLAALAFLRSLAPENTANVVRKLVKPRGDSARAEREELQKLRDEIQRERIALERLQNETGDNRAFLEKFEEFHNAEDERGVVAADQIVIPQPEETSDPVSGDSSSVEEQKRLQDHADASELGQIGVSEEAEEGEDEEYGLQLADDRCQTIIALESSKSGLGTQIEHVLSLLSLSFAVQNACIVLPPISSYDHENNFRPVAFGEIFDEEEFSGTGVRTVPLSSCKEIDVSDVFDDGGAETAIVKNFAAFVRNSDQDMAKETTLVHEETRGHRFEKSSVINGDVTIMAKYIYEKVGSRHNERTCIGFGRMRAEVAINFDILEHLKPASSVASFVASKYPLPNETMFVKMRWNKLHCEHTRTEAGTVCVVSDIILSTEDYVRSIAHTAQQAGVSFIYLSLPTHVPEDVSEYVYENLKILEPILLGVDGDIFTANLIEYELAIQSKVFIPDGGAWSDTVQMLRSSRNPANFRDGIDSSSMVQAWKDAGWPTGSPFLISQSLDIGTHADISKNMSHGEQNSNVMHNGQESQVPFQVDSITQQQETDSNIQPPSAENTLIFLDQKNDSDEAVHAGVTESRPTEYQPPEDYVPNEDADSHLFPNPGNHEGQASQYSQAEQLTTAGLHSLVENPLPAKKGVPAGESAPAEAAAPVEAAAENQIPTEQPGLPDHQLPSEREPHADEQLSAEKQLPAEQPSAVGYETRTEQQILPEKVAVAEEQLRQEQQTRFETVSVQERKLSDQQVASAEQQVTAEQYPQHQQVVQLEATGQFEQSVEPADITEFEQTTQYQNIR